MQKKTLKTIYVLLLLIFISIFSLLIYRVVSSRQIDDVSPTIGCSEELLMKADVLFVVPKFRNISIAENKSWCEYILSLNKTLALHGTYHTYREFGGELKNESLQEGIEIFYECFGFYPSEFKSPQLKTGDENRKLIHNNGMSLDGWPSWFFHKTYHCREDGEYAIHITDKIILTNKFIDWV